MVLGGLLLGAIAMHDDPMAAQRTLEALTPQDIVSALYVSLLGGAASYGGCCQGRLSWLADGTGEGGVCPAMPGMEHVNTSHKCIMLAVHFGHRPLIVRSTMQCCHQPLSDM